MGGVNIAGSMAGKKIKGRKRHIVVDTQGRLLAVHVHSAQIHDATGCETVLRRAALKHPSLQGFNGDEAYRARASRFVEEQLGLIMHITARIQHQFNILPQRWVVERTFAWLSNFRRLSKDFERRVTSAENMIRIAMMKITAQFLLTL